MSRIPAFRLFFRANVCESTENPRLKMEVGLTSPRLFFISEKTTSPIIFGKFYEINGIATRNQSPKYTMKIFKIRVLEYALVTHVNNFMHSIFSKIEEYTINQQTHNSNVFYAEIFFSNNFKGTGVEHKKTSN